MSDYLWDKTGEPDKDVERLEERLGRFRHRARAPELPAQAAGRDAAPTHAPRPTRAPVLLRPARLAVAAALLFVFMAGALLLLLSRNASHGGGRREQAQAAAQKSQGGTRASSDEQSSPRETSVQQNTSPPVAVPGNGETTAGANEVAKRDEQSGPDEQDERSPRGQERRHGGGEVAAKQRGGDGVAGARRSAGEEVEGRATERTVAESASPGEGRAQREQTPEERGGQALEERRRAAKDDLMYVLRLTGLKLKEVQKRTQKVDGWKSAFDPQK